MKIKNYLNFLKALVTKRSPIYVHYGITHRCNLNCRMCSVTLEPLRVSEELDLKGIYKLADFLSSLGIIYISIGGGEPLLRSDICEVIRIFRNKDIEPRLLSNGTLSDQDLIDDLASAGLRHVSISLVSLRPDVQNYICVGSNRANLLENIENFRQRIPRKGRVLIINTMVSRLNLEELPDLVEFARKMDYLISFIPLQDNNDEQLSISDKDHWLVEETYNRLISLRRKRQSNIFNSTRFLELSKIYLKTKKNLWRCDAGRLYFSINPYGEISICHRFAPIYSIINTSPPRKIVNFAQTEFRENCAGCMRPCWAEISLCVRNLGCFRERFYQLGRFFIKGMYGR